MYVNSIGIWNKLGKMDVGRNEIFLQGEDEDFIFTVTKQKIRHTQRLCPIRDPKSFYKTVTAHLHIRNVFKENNQRSFLPR